MEELDIKEKSDAAELIVGINMARNLLPDNISLRKEVKEYKALVESKDRIIAMLKEEAEEARARLVILQAENASLIADSNEVKKRRFEYWLTGILLCISNRKQRRDIRRLNAMIISDGNYNEAQQIFLLDLLKSGVTFNEIKKTFPTSDISIEVMQKIRECM